MHRLLSSLCLAVILGLLGISSASFLSTIDEFKKVDSNKAAKRRSQIIGATANPPNEDERELSADLNEPESGSFMKTIDEYKNIDDNNKLLKKDLEKGNRKLGADLDGDLDCEEIERQCQCSGGGVSPVTPDRPRGPGGPGGPGGPSGPGVPTGPRGPPGRHSGPWPQPRPVTQQKNSYGFQEDSYSDSEYPESGSEDAANDDMKALGIPKPKKMSARLPAIPPTPGTSSDQDGDRQNLGFDMAADSRQVEYPDRGEVFQNRNRNKG